MRFNVNEIFYSLKGEGRWAGTPMKFIRLLGCNLKCPFCDTPDKLLGEFTVDDIIERVKRFPADAKRVVITGGEPLIQDAHALRDALVEEGYLVHLETNGMYDILGHWDWVAVSPKNKDAKPFSLVKADEIKFLIGEPGWQDLIKYYDKLIQPNTLRLAMPVAKGRREDDFTKGSTDIISENVKTAVDFCLKNPRYSLCLQIHKYLNIQ